MKCCFGAVVDLNTLSRNVVKNKDPPLRRVETCTDVAIQQFNKPQKQQSTSTFVILQEHEKSTKQTMKNNSGHDTWN